MSGGWVNSTRRARLPANWPELTAFVLERDGYQCRIHGPRCIGHATQADHIKRGDDHRPGNLQAACQPCHALKSSQEGNEARPRETRDPERHPGLK